MDSRQLRGVDDRNVIVHAINNTEDKLRQIKATILDILAMLELQDRVNFPDLMGLLASLSSDFSALQELMKKSCVPSRPEDNGIFLKAALLVPNFISLDEDSKLLAETENRVSSWNHEVLPNYLRTQLAPHVIEQERSLEKEIQLRQADVIGKQIQSMNKNIDVVHGVEASRNIFTTTDRSSNFPQFQNTSTKSDLKTLVLGVMRGNGIKPKVPEMNRIKKQ